MRRLLLLFALLFLGSPAWATFGFVQQANNSSCSGATCTVTVTSTGAGHLGIIDVIAVNNVTISSISGFTLCGVNCQAFDGAGSAGSIDAAYWLAMTGGQTSFLVTFSGVTGGAIVKFTEYSYTASVLAFDTAANVLRSVAANPQAGPAFSLSGTNDLVVQYCNASANMSSIASPYNTAPSPDVATCTAWNINTTSNTAASWTATGSYHGAFAMLAFKEISSSATKSHSALVIF